MQVLKLFLQIIIFGYICTEEEAKTEDKIGIPHISSASEKSDLLKGENFFIHEFYMPGCPHCTAVAPVLRKIHDKGDIKVYQTRCGREKGEATFCQEEEALGYPDIRFYKSFEDSTVKSCKYKEGRSQEAIEKSFLEFKEKELITKEVSNLNDFYELEELKDGSKAYVALVLKEEDNSEKIIALFKSFMLCQFGFENFLVKVENEGEVEESLMIQNVPNLNERYEIKIGKIIKKISENFGDDEKLKQISEEQTKEMEMNLEINKMLPVLHRFNHRAVPFYFSFKVPIIFHTLKKNPNYVPKFKKAENQEENKENKEEEEEIENFEEKYSNFKYAKSIYKMVRERKFGNLSISLFVDEHEDASLVDALGMGPFNEGNLKVTDPDGGYVMALVHNSEKERLDKYKMIEKDEGNLEKFMGDFYDDKLEIFMKSASIPSYNLDDVEKNGGEVLEVVGNNLENFLNFKESSFHKAAVLIVYFGQSLNNDKRTEKAMQIVEELAKLNNEYRIENKGDKEKKFLRVGKFEIFNNEHQEIDHSSKVRILLYLENGEKVSYEDIMNKGLDGLKELIKEKTGIELVHVEEEPDTEL